MTKIAAVMLAFAMGERLSSIIADKDDVRNVAGLRDEHGHMSEGEHGQTPTWPLLGMGGHCAENGNRPQVCFTSAGAPVASQATCEQDCASLSACVAYEYGPNSGVVYCQLVIPTPVGQTASCPSGFTWGWGHQDGQSVNGIQAHAHMPQTGCYTRPSSSSSGSSGPSMSNHLDITTATRDACVSGKVAGRTALTDGAACSAETNVTCATKYEQKSRSTHRVGQDGSTDYSGSYDLVGELHLCEWRPELDRCEAGKVLTVCPEGDHVVEVSAGAGSSSSGGGNSYVDGVRTHDNAYSTSGQCDNAGSTYGTLAQAEAWCDADPACTWLHDWGCDGQSWRYCTGTRVEVSGGGACTKDKVASSATVTSVHSGTELFSKFSCANLANGFPWYCGAAETCCTGTDGVSGSCRYGSNDPALVGLQAGDVYLHPQSNVVGECTIDLSAFGTCTTFAGRYRIQDNNGAVHGNFQSSILIGGVEVGNSGTMSSSSSQDVDFSVQIPSGQTSVVVRVDPLGSWGSDWFVLQNAAVTCGGGAGGSWVTMASAEGNTNANAAWIDGFCGQYGTFRTTDTLRVTMGQVQDYFKPNNDMSVCDFLKSRTSHTWSATENGNFVQPTYYGGHYGGSQAHWPQSQDGRTYLSFWGGGGGANGGCCHYTSTNYGGAADGAAWSRAFTLSIKQGAGR